MNSKKIIIILIAILTIKGIIWSIAIPLFHGNDEHFHYATIQSYNIPNEYTGNGNAQEKNRTTFEDIDTHNLSPELKNFLFSSSVDETRFYPENTANFDDFSQYGEREHETKNASLKNHVLALPAWKSNQPQLFYRLGSLIEKKLSAFDVGTRALAIRFLSVSFGVFLSLTAFFIFKEVGLNQKKSLLLSLMVSFQPMLCYITSIINIDSLLYFSFSLFILGSVRFIRNKLNLLTFFIILAGFTISILTKYTGWIIILFISILLFIWIIKYKKIKLVIITPLLIVSSSLIYLIIPKIIKSKINISGLNIEQIKAFLFEHFSIYPLIHNSKLYWGFFGNFDTPIHRFILYFIWFIIGISIIGIIKFLFKLIKNNNNFGEKNIYLVFYFISIVLILHISILLVDLPFFLEKGRIGICAPGRYFLPLIIAKFYLIFFGLSYLIPKKYHTQLLTTLLIMMIVLNNYSLFQILIPRFYL